MDWAFVPIIAQPDSTDTSSTTEIIPSSWMKKFQVQTLRFEKKNSFSFGALHPVSFLCASLLSCISAVHDSSSSVVQVGISKYIVREVLLFPINISLHWGIAIICASSNMKTNRVEGSKLLEILLCRDRDTRGRRYRSIQDTSYGSEAFWMTCFSRVIMKDWILWFTFFTESL